MVNRVQAGQQLGNYRLVRRLGAGGFAEVYLGEHRYLKRQVAIKVLLVELSGDDRESERFLSEAQTMAALKHPHIIGCLDFGIEHNVPYIVMDYAPGGTLRDLHPEGNLVPLDTVVASVEQVADALQYAHDQGVIHLDVKPENMLLGQSGEILLSDFGLARFTRSVSKRVTSLVGTISYMAPEYIQRKPQAASDQYSLAMVAYEWLTGVRPFDGDDERIVVGQQLQTLPPCSGRSEPWLWPPPQAGVWVIVKPWRRCRLPSFLSEASRLHSCSPFPWRIWAMPIPLPAPISRRSPPAFLAPKM